MANLVVLGLIPPSGRTQSNRNLSTVLKSLAAECRNCSPISPMQCIDRCKAYKLKNELLSLRKSMANPNYTKELLNVLKNETRLQILQAIANGRYSVGKLQQKLKKSGYNHSQTNINEQYLRPLVLIGLAAQTRDEYYATTFGDRLAQLLPRFQGFAKKLPAHSEGYEENLLQAMLTGEKVFEDIETIVPHQNVSRVLKRLCSAKLIATPKERDYIFFFKSKRDPTKENLTTTEWKIYAAIADTGISAGNLAKETRLSRRITYKYLRCLRGKKLVFTRKKPKAYRLTCTGEKIASSLRSVQQIVEDTWNSSEQVMQDVKLVTNTGGYLNHALLT